MLADKYITKDYTLESLTKAVRELLSECDVELDTTQIDESNIDEWCWIAGVYSFINIPYNIAAMQILRQYLYDTNKLGMTRKKSNALEPKKALKKQKSKTSKRVVRGSRESDSPMRIVRLS